MNNLIIAGNQDGEKNNNWIFVVLLTLALSSYSSVSPSKTTFQTPSSILSQPVYDPSSVVSVSEWKDILGTAPQDYEDNHEMGKQTLLLNISTALLNSGQELGNSANTNGLKKRVFRLLLMGLIVYEAARENTAPDMTSLLTNNFYDKSNYEKSLENLHSVLPIKWLAVEKSYKVRTPLEKRPDIHSKNALAGLLEQVINGKQLSFFWCERNWETRKELFSPRSFKILGDPPYDNYIRGVYRNIHNVRIESSNQGGSPIVVTWKVGLFYARPMNQDQLAWCISYFDKAPPIKHSWKN